MDAITHFANWWWSHVIASCDLMMWFGIIAAVMCAVAAICLIRRETAWLEWWHVALGIILGFVSFWIWPVVCIVVVVIYALVLVGEVVDI